MLVITKREPLCISWTLGQCYIPLSAGHLLCDVLELLLPSLVLRSARTFLTRVQTPPPAEMTNVFEGNKSCPTPVHNEVISGFQALHQVRTLVARLEPATEGSLQDLKADTRASVPQTPPQAKMLGITSF
ncbi:hypothetical protein PoB_000289600 [Plakobranchus ocellatus]|uniref:Uncharacterized protein n=1 Tax=Plakobranchus ocellatus TaxID=259542 RepID=A0AAV3Y1X9_9GAST|nr:hypothetical protein PoB_000289600 [Plakobranchus ocellatus]